MIRPAQPADTASILELAVASGMFGADETEPLAEVLTGYFAGEAGEGDAWVIDEHEGVSVGVAYYSPAPFADRTWYVKMIAVHPDRQGNGRGATLMRHVEEALRTTGQRVLLVETSGLPKYDRTREFYAKCGYDREARIRDFYTDGDDMIVFRKALNVA